MSKLSTENIDFVESFFSEKFKGNYSVLISKYGIKFVNGTDKISLSDNMNNRVFACYQNIINHLKYNPVWDQVRVKEIKFNGYDNKLFLSDQNLKNCYNIDIKGAYPTALRNLKLIDNIIYSKLLSLPKLDRLKAIGMTAKRNTQFDLVENKIVSFKPNESEYKNCYLAAAKEIENTMEYIKTIALDYFIFTWVDGIFLRPETPKNTITEICRSLAELNYQYHLNILDLEIRRYRNVLNITTVKDGSIKEFKFRDIYFKKLNERTTNKFFTRLKKQQNENS